MKNRKAIAVTALFIVVAFSILLFSLSNGKSHADMHRICIQSNSPICGESFSIRLTKENIWQDTYDDGTTIRGMVQFIYGMPIRWYFLILQSGDDWSAQSEYFTLYPFKKNGKSERLGYFQTEIVLKDGKWEMTVKLTDRKDTILISQSLEYPFW